MITRMLGMLLACAVACTTAAEPELGTPPDDLPFALPEQPLALSDTGDQLPVYFEPDAVQFSAEFGWDATAGGPVVVEDASGNELEPVIRIRLGRGGELNIEDPSCVVEISLRDGTARPGLEADPSRYAGIDRSPTSGVTTTCEGDLALSPVGTFGGDAIAFFTEEHDQFAVVGAMSTEIQELIDLQYPEFADWLGGQISTPASFSSDPNADPQTDRIYTIPYAVDGDFRVALDGNGAPIIQTSAEAWNGAALSSGYYVMQQYGYFVLF